MSLGFSPGSGADVPNSQRAEVEHLIAYLGRSDCALVRNGKSHSPEEGVRHVRRKYDHFRDDISSTEDFIELAASRSTLSGRDYEVRCPGKAPLSSRDWLTRELQRFRLR